MPATSSLFSEPEVCGTRVTNSECPPGNALYPAKIAAFVYKLLEAPVKGVQDPRIPITLEEENYLLSSVRKIEQELAHQDHLLPRKRSAFELYLEQSEEEQEGGVQL